MNLGCKAGGIGWRAELNADAVPPVAVVVVLAEVACEARCVWCSRRVRRLAGLTVMRAETYPVCVGCGRIGLCLPRGRWSCRGRTSPSLSGGCDLAW